MNACTVRVNKKRVLRQNFYKPMIILFIAKNGTKYVQFKFFGIFQLFLTVDILTDFDSLYQFISK